MDPDIAEVFAKLDEMGEDAARDAVATNLFGARTPTVRLWLDKKNIEKNERWLADQKAHADASYRLTERATIAAEKSAGASEKAALASERSANYTRAAGWAAAIAAVVSLVTALIPYLGRLSCFVSVSSCS